MSHLQGTTCLMAGVRLFSDITGSLILTQVPSEWDSSTRCVMSTEGKWLLPTNLFPLWTSLSQFFFSNTRFSHYPRLEILE